jgi:hypothetical protein
MHSCRRDLNDAPSINVVPARHNASVRSAMQNIKPTAAKTIRAFAIAPLASAIVLWLVAAAPKLVQLLLSDAKPGLKQFMAIGMVMQIIFFAVVAYTQALVVGVPLYLAIRWCGWVNAVSVMGISLLSGLALGALIGKQAILFASAGGLVAGITFYAIIRTSNKALNTDAPKDGAPVS